LFPHRTDKVVVFFQGGSLYPGFFFRKLPAVLPERIDIPGEKGCGYLFKERFRKALQSSKNEDKSETYFSG
jgi:hypothetical protein